MNRSIPIGSDEIVLHVTSDPLFPTDRYLLEILHSAPLLFNTLAFIKTNVLLVDEPALVHIDVPNAAIGSLSIHGNLSGRVACFQPPFSSHVSLPYLVFSYVFRSLSSKIY